MLALSLSQRPTQPVASVHSVQSMTFTVDPQNYLALNFRVGPHLLWSLCFVYHLQCHTNAGSVLYS